MSIPNLFTLASEVANAGDGSTLPSTSSWIGIVLAVAGILGGAIRWSASIVRDAMAANAATMRELAKASQDVIRDNAAAFARLSEWLGRVDVRTEDAAARVTEIHQEISGVHDSRDLTAEGRRGPDEAPLQPEGATIGSVRGKGRTPPLGYPTVQGPSPGAGSYFVQRKKVDG